MNQIKSVRAPFPAKEGAGLRNEDNFVAGRRAAELELDQLTGAGMKNFRMDVNHIEPPSGVSFATPLSQEGPPSPLTGRELEIIALSLSPLARKEIARRLGVSEPDLSREFEAIYAKLGVSDRLDLLIEAYHHDLEIADVANKCRALAHLGDVYLRSGKIESAIECYEEQLELTRSIKDRSGEGEVFCHLGKAFNLRGESLPAINYYEQCLSVARQLGDRRREGDALSGLGQAYIPLGYLRYAIKCSERALSIFRKMDDSDGQGKALFNLSLAVGKLGYRWQAALLAQKAAKIFREHGSTEAATAQEHFASRPGWLGSSETQDDVIWSETGAAAFP